MKSSISHIHRYRKSSCVHCPSQQKLGLLLRWMHALHRKQDGMIQILMVKEEEETVYRDTEYVRERVGISKSTLLRYQNQGAIQIAKIVNKKKMFRDRDVEYFRKVYWGIS